MLTKSRITQLLLSHDSGLAVTPLLDADQIDEAAVDLRLGPDLVVTSRETGVVAFDPRAADEMRERVGEYQRYVRRPLGTAFYLHPGDFAIARSLEFVTLPGNISAQATGRSSWGRLGLVIATATLIQPKFAGTITLELANVGRVPLILYVGTRIAQLSFFAASG
jgi:dCTP deaminase